MFWFIVIVVLIVVAYKVLSNDIRKTSKLIGHRINIKPTIITGCIAKMRQDASASIPGLSRQRMFCQMVANSGHSEENLARYVKVIYIYQLLNNPHRENVNWWSTRMRESGISPEISVKDRSDFEVFYDIDHHEFRTFVEAHNRELNKPNVSDVENSDSEVAPSFIHETDAEEPCSNCGSLTNRVIGSYYVCKSCTS
ncbi:MULTISPECIES: DUF1198 family protein [Vibrio]|uniref:DUF1198 family protein n=1 Tax=Vibrio TaxID=662 RepID=UPI0014822D34|nr:MULTISPECIES: DUF1198 family protein [Vibrio]MCA2441528.1 DUF1198 family protein [Vibrio alginolyticus]MCR9538556.1 DUF1198 family protein [Vibrio alginolyticus]MDW1731920.1 DUF1198 family protein [Vibrio sp. Vb2356]MDW1934116.1 DUF1198 family protein [Vibrio sp. 970]HCZ9282900.1 DUF1198 family protein [Vibrio alginolyticus]